MADCWPLVSPPGKWKSKSKSSTASRRRSRVDCAPTERRSSAPATRGRCGGGFVIGFVVARETQDARAAGACCSPCSSWRRRFERGWRLPSAAKLAGSQSPQGPAPQKGNDKGNDKGKKRTAAQEEGRGGENQGGEGPMQRERQEEEARRHGRCRRCGQRGVG